MGHVPQLQRKWDIKHFQTLLYVDHISQTFILDDFPRYMQYFLSTMWDDEYIYIYDICEDIFEQTWEI